RGMSRRELLLDLLVPFRSGKSDTLDAIGEHGVGFFSALELAPLVEVTTVSRDEGWQLTIEPIGARAPFTDFRWTIRPLTLTQTRTGRGARPTGTSVRLWMQHGLPSMVLWTDLLSAAGYVDPAVARIYHNGALLNVARVRMRRVARVAIGQFGGELELL